MIKWIKKNWIALGLVILVIIIFGNRLCTSAGYRKDIKKSDAKISGLEKENKKLDDVVNESIENATAAEKVVAEKEAIIAARDITIRGLRERRAVVMEEVMELPPSKLVEETQEILSCTEIELKEDGILFSVECARRSLVLNKQFSFLFAENEELQLSLTASLEATHFQKVATWYIYRLAWAQGSQILNYKEIGREKDLKFDLCEKERKRSWLGGLWKGFVIGVVVGVVVSVTVKTLFE